MPDEQQHVEERIARMVISCANPDCRKKIGAVHFASSTGVVEFFECACGWNTEVVNGAVGARIIGKQNRKKSGS